MKVNVNGGKIQGQNESLSYNYIQNIPLRNWLSSLSGAKGAPARKKSLHARLRAGAVGAQWLFMATFSYSLPFS